MKKIITMLGVILVTTTASTTIVACNDPAVQPKPAPPKPIPLTPIIIAKINISKKIPNKIDLEQLSANTKEAFLEKLQSNLRKITDLQAIQRSDYHVYKAGTTSEIEDNDVINNTSLSIKIQTTKNKNFTGIKDNIIVSYSKNILEHQDTIYLDENGKPQITSEHDLANLNTKEIIQIGFYKNSNEEIQAVKMPKTIEKVPTQLPPEITSTKDMFNFKWLGATFNQDISNWDVSNVTNMSAMFYDAVSFNQNLSKWNTAKVTDMSWMFAGAKTFNQNISNWNVTKVKNMSYMFYDAASFN